MAVECAYQTTESGFGHRKMWIFLTMIKKTYLDNSHTIEIEAKGLLIRMSNDVQLVLLKLLLDALKEPLC